MSLVQSRVCLLLSFCCPLLLGCGLLLDLDPQPEARPSDGGAMDAAARDGSTDASTDASIDGGPVCSGQPDGSACALPDQPDEPRVCVGEACVLSRCGDAIVDLRDEVCDDGNAIDADGCRRDCTHSCEVSADCPTVSEPCLMAPACVEHRCERRPQPAGTTCTAPDGDTGMCRAGFCANALCGNGAIDGTEQCDDGNPDPDDGCEPDCRFGCSFDADCDDLVFCTGVERCEATAFGRACTGGAVACPEPSDACGTGFCDVGEDACGVLAFDADMDGHGAGSCGGDCQDTDPDIHPGALEVCNLTDDDCDARVDEGATVTCHADMDGDGFGRPLASSVGCACPAGSVRVGGDCHDGEPTVRPDQRTFSADPYRPPSSSVESWDWNCDGTEEPRWPSNVGFGEPPTCGPPDATGACADEGLWLSDAIPSCGDGGGGLSVCTADVALDRCIRTEIGEARQECR